MNEIPKVIFWITIGGIILVAGLWKIVEWIIKLGVIEFVIGFIVGIVILLTIGFWKFIK